MTTQTSFTLVIATDNAAFEPDPVPELVRLLREIANQMERDEHGIFPSRTIRDANGNDVGHYCHHPVTQIHERTV